MAVLTKEVKEFAKKIGFIYSAKMNIFLYKNQYVSIQETVDYFNEVQKIKNR